MILIQRFLGLCAELYARTSQFNLHVIPASWFVLTSSFMFVSWSAQRLDDSRANSAAPRVCTMAEFFEHRREFRNRQAVTISGTWKPEEAPVRKLNARSDSQVLVPLFDEASGRVLMVATVDPWSIGKRTTSVQVSGLLRACPVHILAELDKWPNSRGRLERHFYLDADSLPGRTWVDALVMLAALSLCSAWCFIMFKRGIIFERSASAAFDQAALDAAPTESLGLRASGKFKCGRESRRFLDTEVTLFERFDRVYVLVTTDTVSSFVGFTRKTEFVTWELVLTPARSIVPGFQYFGTQRRHAVRYRGQGGERVVIAFRSEADRARIARNLVAKRDLAA